MFENERCKRARTTFGSISDNTTATERLCALARARALTIRECRIHFTFHPINEEITLESYQFVYDIESFGLRALSTYPLLGIYV